MQCWMRWDASEELAGLFRNVTYTLENTRLRSFGLSHFVVWRKR